MNAHPLFDAQQGKAAKEEALERVKKNAPPSWLSTARAIATRLARAKPNGFTTDDVWAILDETGVGNPPEPRAMGSVMASLARERIIRKKAVPPIPSMRVACNRRPVAVWEGCGTHSAKVQ